MRTDKVVEVIEVDQAWITAPEPECSVPEEAPTTAPVGEQAAAQPG